ncbi:hypothetical protein CALVIDRAFT_533266 [Calocera viscosa TUFC12733]|uniref:Uncharacterized protein n=1 Tax=Calocera viscosa (strain TUFC12733) TaxID=1330018 RepID=A0A167RII0_CALVF|nr:hypothetical protein CALVIDRAFT_533266 [Calocera viscosa TUFC12733]
MPVTFPDLEDGASTELDFHTNSHLKELTLVCCWGRPAGGLAKFIQAMFPRLQTCSCCGFGYRGQCNTITPSLPGVRSIRGDKVLEGWFERYPGRPLPPPGEVIAESAIEAAERRFFPRWREPAER